MNRRPLVTAATGGAVATAAILGLALPATADLNEVPKYDSSVSTDEAKGKKESVTPDSTDLDAAAAEAQAAGLPVTDKGTDTIETTQDDLPGAVDDANASYATQAKDIRAGIADYQEKHAQYEKDLAAYNTAVEGQVDGANPDVALTPDKLAVDQPFDLSNNRNSLASISVASRDVTPGSVVSDSYNSDRVLEVGANSDFTVKWNGIGTDIESGRPLNATLTVSNIVVDKGADASAPWAPNVQVYSNYVDNISLFGVTSAKQTLTITYADNGQSYDKRYYSNFGSLNAQSKGKRYEFAAPGEGVVASFINPGSYIGREAQPISGSGARGGAGKAFMVPQGEDQRHSIGDQTDSAMRLIGVTFLVNNGASTYVGTSGSGGAEPQRISASDPSNVTGNFVWATYNHVMLSTQTVAPTAVKPPEPAKPELTITKRVLEFPAPVGEKVANGAGKTVLPGQTTTQTVTMNTGSGAPLTSFAIGDNIYFTEDGRLPVTVDPAALTVTNEAGENVTDQFTITTGDTEVDGEKVHQIVAVAKDPGSLPANADYTLNVQQVGVDDGIADQQVDSGFVVRNGEMQYTDRFTYEEPTVEPHKYDTAPKTYVDINTKNVVAGDVLQYVIVNDTSDLANTIDPLTKQGIVDHYDTEHGTIDPAQVKVYQLPGDTDASLGSVTDILKQDPTEVTDSFDITDNGTEGLSVMMKTGEDGAVVLPMGYKYVVVMPYTVTTSDTTTIPNQALQVTNDWTVDTERVTNPLVPLKPEKDVVVTVGGDSVDGSEIALDSTFNYELNSSTRPANYGGETSKWTIFDDYNEAFDEYSGQFVVQNRFDYVDADGNTVKAGTDISRYFEQAVDQGTGAVSFTANQEYLDLMNLDANKGTEQGWTAYIQMKRTAPSEKVTNTFTENVNGTDLDSNEVRTSTPEKPTPAKPEEPTKPAVHTGGTPESTDNTALAVGGGLAGLGLLASLGAIWRHRKKNASNRG